MGVNTSPMIGKDVIWAVTKGGGATKERLQKNMA